MSGGIGDGPAVVPPVIPFKEHRILRGHKGPLQVVCFNSDGKYLLTGGQDRNVVLWNPYRDAPEGEATGGYILQQYSAHGYEVTDIAVTSDNARFASVGGDKCAFLWDTGTGAVVRKYFGHQHRLSCCAFNADGTVLFTGSNDKTVRFWDVKSASRAPIQTVADFKDNVTRIVVGEGAIIASSLDGTVRTYDMRAGKCITDDITAPITSMALSNDGNCMLVATARESGTLALVDRLGGSVLSTYRGHINSAYRVIPTFTSSDSHVICGSENGDVVFWDLVDASITAVLPAHKRVVSCVAHHPSPLVQLMATASFDSTAKIFAGSSQDVRSLSVIRHGDDD